VAVDIAVGVAWALAILFAFALVHKMRVLRAGSAAEEPVVAAHASSRPAAALAVAGLLEAATIAALVAVPAAGLVAAAVLVALYALALRAVPPDAPCHCFGASSSTRSGAAIHRNVALAALAAAAAGLSLAGGDGEPARAFGVALVVLAAIAALEAVERLPRPITTEEP
jgi:hypothetical protein